MDFIKQYWGYLVLCAAILGAAAAIVYLLFFPSARDPYAGGMLVKAIFELGEGMAA